MILLYRNSYTCQCVLYGVFFSRFLLLSIEVFSKKQIEQTYVNSLKTYGSFH